MVEVLRTQDILGLSSTGYADPDDWLARDSDVECPIYLVVYPGPRHTDHADRGGAGVRVGPHAPRAPQGGRAARARDPRVRRGGGVDVPGLGAGPARADGRRGGRFDACV